jgi:hypothetical protein
MKLKIIAIAFVTLLLSTLIVFIGGLIILTFSTFITRVSRAEIVDLNEVTLTYKNYQMVHKNNRHLLLWPEKPKEAITTTLNFDILKYAFWNNNIHAMTTDSQYRSIGLETRLGIRILPQLDISFYHFSQHLLERAHSSVLPYPLEDAVEIRFNIFNKNKRDSIGTDIINLFKHK